MLVSNLCPESSGIIMNEWELSHQIWCVMYNSTTTTAKTSRYAFAMGAFRSLTVLWSNRLIDFNSVEQQGQLTGLLICLNEPALQCQMVFCYHMRCCRSLKSMGPEQAMMHMHTAWQRSNNGNWHNASVPARHLPHLSPHDLRSSSNICTVIICFSVFVACRLSATSSASDQVESVKDQLNILKIDEVVQELR